jgi:hypothetical protein
VKCRYCEKNIEDNEYPTMVYSLEETFCLHRIENEAQFIGKQTPGYKVADVPSILKSYVDHTNKEENQ